MCEERQLQLINLLCYLARAVFKGLIIYMKKLLNSHWLKAVHFKCNSYTVAESVMPMQITQHNCGLCALKDNMMKILCWNFEKHFLKWEKKASWSWLVLCVPHLLQLSMLDFPLILWVNCLFLIEFTHKITSLWCVWRTRLQITSNLLSCLLITNTILLGILTSNNFMFPLFVYLESHWFTKLGLQSWTKR